MARAVALSQLRTDARLYADQRQTGASAFISDTNLNRLLNLNLSKLYDLLVAARGHEYYASESTISIVAGTARYNLPATFYELLSATLEWATGNHEPLIDLANVDDRAHYANWNSWSQWEPKAYRLRVAQIEILPTPTTAVTCRLQFIPVFTDLAMDADTFDGVNGWEKLVTLATAKEMRAIQKQPYGDLDKLYGEEYERIEDLAAERAANAPKRVRDVSPEGAVRNGWPPLPRRVTV